MSAAINVPERFTLSGVAWVREPAEDTASALYGPLLAYRRAEPCDESRGHAMHALGHPERHAHLDWLAVDEAIRASSDGACCPHTRCPGESLCCCRGDD